MSAWSAHQSKQCDSATCYYCTRPDVSQTIRLWHPEAWKNHTERERLRKEMGISEA